MKVLVVDDSSLFRRLMTEVLSTFPDIEVIGQAQNGKIALDKCRELKPDLLTLDLEMPEMDGLQVLDALKEEGAMPAVLVVSALTQRGSQLTIQALQKGAFDFITKPDSSSAVQSRDLLHSEFAARFKALSLRREIHSILGGRGTFERKSSSTKDPLSPIPDPKPNTIPKRIPDPVTSGDTAARMIRLSSKTKPELILIGVSTGGPTALATLLPSLPEKIGLPILIVQHMPPIFTRSLADSLNAKCRLTVQEAEDGNILSPDTVYIAPGGHHMRIAAGPATTKIIQITDDPPENNCRPAVDYLFRSVAKNFPVPTLGIILTGMGSDGTLGLRLLKRNNCFIIAQDEASCVVYGMPKAAVEAGIVDEVLPLDSIAAAVVSVVKSGHP